MKEKTNFINTNEILNALDEYWSPVVVAEMNGHHFKLARIVGEFIWHRHDNTDEAFFVLKGNMKIYFRDHVVELSEGDLLVVPEGVEHKPFAQNECHILLVEKVGTVNTGNITPA